MPLLLPHAKAPAALSRRWESGNSRHGGKEAAPSLPQPPPCPAAALPQLPAGRALPSPPHSTSDSNKHDFSSFLFFPPVSSACRRCVQGGQRALGPGGHHLVALKSLLNYNLLFPSSVPASSNLPSVSLAAPMLKWPGFEVPLPVVSK